MTLQLRATFLTSFLFHFTVAQISPEHCTVFGPALDGRVSAPANPVYVQAANAKGENLTKSQGRNAFHISAVVESKDAAKKMNAKTQFYDHGNGLYSALIIMPPGGPRMRISVMTGGKHVKGSPFLVKGIATDGCHCPLPPESFEQGYQCLPQEAQLEKDKAKWKQNLPNGKIGKDTVGSAIRSLMQTAKKQQDARSFIHYRIKDQKVYRRCYGRYDGFKGMTDRYLQAVVQKVKLPDFEFIWNLGDWPLARYNESHQSLPVISWCGSDQTTDAILPTYKIMDGTFLGTQIENVLECDGGCAQHHGGWHTKIEKLFFRGRDSNPVRVKFTQGIAKERPDIIDAQLTKNEYNYYPSEEDRRRDKESGMYALKVDRTKGQLNDYWKYKYLLIIDGTVSAYRTPALLAGDSVVFIQESVYYEHFYTELKPFVHFIPLKNDLSDVVEKIRWAKKNDDKCQQISKNARDLMRARMIPSQLMCYHWRFFSEYAKLIDYKIPEVTTKHSRTVPDKTTTDDPMPSLDEISRGDLMVKVYSKEQNTQQDKCKCYYKAWGVTKEQLYGEPAKPEKTEL